jgi:apolipoprotein D and lipocalin family protein
MRRRKGVDTGRAVRWVLSLALALIVATGAPGGASTTMAEQNQAPVSTVASVDLDRYLGEWYEVARYENRFQRKCLGDVKARYARQPNGTVQVVNSCRTGQGTTVAEGQARVVDAATRAKLKVRFAPAFLSFLPFVWGDYWIIGLDENYRWAVVGSPDRAYLWVLSRTPVLDDGLFQRALEKARANGFDTTKLLSTRQGR